MHSSLRLHVFDHRSKYTFLADSGAEISVLPVSLFPKAQLTPIKLEAANESVMNTYGLHTLQLQFKLRTPFTWNFVITDVPLPILGADFIHFFDLLIDLGQAKLVTRKNKVFASGKCLHSPTYNIALLSQSHPFYDILSQFPTTYDSQFRQAIKESAVCHYLHTEGHPVSAKARKLPSDKLKIAKAYFADLVAKGLAIRAFEACKDGLANAALLSFPVDSAPIRICSDASNTAMGGVLEQENKPGHWFPLAFFSRKFNHAQKNYSTYDRELTAAVESIKHFQYDVESRKFILGTDHKPLLQALAQKHENAIPRRARQLEFLSLFDIEMVHLPGIHNNVADALSRIESLYSISAIDQDTYAMFQSINAFKLPSAINMQDFCIKQLEDQELPKILEDPSHPLKLVKFAWPSTNQFFYANVQDNNIRPYLPESLRLTIFNIYHGLSHPSGRVTDRLIRRSYVWPNMTRDITNWCKCCLDCQQSKISRYNKLSPAQFIAPDARFQHIHVDLVGPLPIREGYRFILSIIDRFSRWPEAIPLRDSTAPTVTQAIFDHWISRYGTPSIITSDQGSQFEGSVFAEFTRLFGIQRIRTTSYHPSSNGMVERWHRDLKSALMCRTYTDFHRITI
uniref:RNA-directed DNA polymerase n=1 Tax=Trichogramma kaykai TaxID=54128 RepID=A0ABD2XR19_9HYME